MMWEESTWELVRDIVVDNCYTEYTGGEWVGRCYSYPSLSHSADNAEESLDGIEELAVLMLINIEGDDNV